MSVDPVSVIWAFHISFETVSRTLSPSVTNLSQHMFALLFNLFWSRCRFDFKLHYFNVQLNFTFIFIFLSFCHFRHGLRFEASKIT